MANRSRSSVRERVIVPKGLSKTKKSMAEGCDINKIMSKFNKTGLLSQMINANPIYGDFTNTPTYETALNTVIKAQQQFEALPSRLRNKFGNNPAEFLNFVNNAKLEELETEGLLKPEKLAELEAERKKHLTHPIAPLPIVPPKEG